MTRLVVLFALAAGLSACSSSPFSSAPAAGVRPTPTGTTIPNLPASQYECVTDEGYGRWAPCGNKS